MSRTDAVLEWLRALGAALSARQLYRADHPRVLDAVAALAAASDRLVADRDETSLFMIEGRLACDDETIPGAGPIALRVFGSLSACGFDRLTIRRGVTAAELLDLVSACAGASRDGRVAPPALHSTSHVRFSVLDVDGRAAPGAPPRPAVHVPVSPQQVSALWSGVEREQTLDADLLDRLIAPLVQLVQDDGGEILPLQTLQSHDEYTATHITNVSVLTMALAEALGLAAPAVRQVGVASLLHDIGKMRIPASILNSTTRLSAEQLGVMREHPRIGARMLMATPGLPPLAAIVAFEHHLQADGGGYPDVPAGWRINPASAMTHIADVYDALRTHRPYRAAMEHERIVDLMIRDRGTVFPAEMLDVFFDKVVPRARRPRGLDEVLPAAPQAPGSTARPGRTY
jgi:HD-GYP domain-containing protein (c-di-GMP phosphodiesterase class II)